MEEFVDKELDETQSNVRKSNEQIKFNRYCNKLPTWHPKYRFLENRTHKFLEVILPGISTKNLKLKLENNYISIKNIKYPTENDIRLYKCGYGINFGNVDMKINLPNHISKTGAEVTYQNNKLIVKFNKILKRNPFCHNRMLPSFFSSW